MLCGCPCQSYTPKTAYQWWKTADFNTAHAHRTVRPHGLHPHICTVFTTRCLNSYFEGWRLTHQVQFPYMDPRKAVLYGVTLVQVDSLILLLPAVMLGAICGAAGLPFRSSSRRGWR